MLISRARRGAVVMKTFMLRLAVSLGGGLLLTGLLWLVLRLVLKALGVM